LKNGLNEMGDEREIISFKNIRVNQAVFNFEIEKLIRQRKERFYSEKY
jgi:hypothetical protein